MISSRMRSYSGFLRRCTDLPPAIFARRRKNRHIPPHYQLPLFLSLSLHSNGDFLDSCSFDCVLYGLDAIERAGECLEKSLEHHGIDYLNYKFHTSGCYSTWFFQTGCKAKTAVNRSNSVFSALLTYKIWTLTWNGHVTFMGQPLFSRTSFDYMYTSAEPFITAGSEQQMLRIVGSHKALPSSP